MAHQKPAVPNTPLVKRLQHFFKIILQSTIEDKKLMLPPKFVKKHGDELSDVAKITSPDGNVWQMGLTKGQNSMWFDGGWPKFVEDHSICHGHVLVFEYEGMSNFNVLIFDTSACEIDYQYEPSRDDEVPHNGKRYSMHDKNQVQDDFVEKLSFTSSPEGEVGESRKRFTSLSQQNLIFSTLVSDHMSMNKRHKCDPSLKHPKFEHDYQTRGKMNGIEHSRNDEKESSPKCEEQSKIITTRNFYQVLAKMSPRRERAVQPAMLYQPKNISFMFVFRQRNHKTLYMPASFCKYLDRSTEYIKVLVTDGREWLIRTCWRKYGSMDLSSGLAEFSRDNSLGEGDVCFFELIMLKTIALKASIFHDTCCDSAPKAKMHKKISASAETSDFEKIYDRSKSCKTEKKNVPAIVINNANESKERESNRSGGVRNNKADGSEFSAEDEDMNIATSCRFNFYVKTSKESKKALQTARTFKPSNPSFMAILHESNLRKCFMYVPAKFAWKYLNGVPEYLSVQSSDGKKWLVRRGWRQYGGLHIFTGRTNFYEDNDLKAGDICVFELIELKKFVLKLTIFRAS